MVGKGRKGRVLGGRKAVELGDLAKACPKCGAGIGHSCFRKSNLQGFVPLKNVHAERKG